MAYKVFISYSTQDLPYVNATKAYLESFGIKTFVAQYDIPPGANIGEDVGKAINASDAFLVLWSGNARQSGWVQSEIGVARQAGKLIVPVLLHTNIEPPAFLPGIKCMRAWEPGDCSLLVGDLMKRSDSKDLGSAALVFLAIVLVIAVVFGKE